MGCCNPTKSAMIQAVVLVGIAAGAAALNFGGATKQRAIIERSLTRSAPAVETEVKTPIKTASSGSNQTDASQTDPSSESDAGAPPPTASPEDSAQQSPDAAGGSFIDSLGELISIEQAVQIYNLQYDENNTRQVIFLDAREADKFAESHIPGAFNLTPDSFFNDTLPEGVGFWPKDSLIVVYCSGGECDASHLVQARLMQEKAFTSVFIIQAGLPGWQSAGLPTE